MVFLGLIVQKVYEQTNNLEDIDPIGQDGERSIHTRHLPAISFAKSESDSPKTAYATEVS